MNERWDKAAWMVAAILAARLIFAGVFAMAAAFKFMGMDATASYIAAAGFPFPLLLAWLAALFETALVLCFLSGACFSEAALLAEFGFFVDHFTFIAGLLFAAVHGPGPAFAIRRSLVRRE